MHEGLRKNPHTAEHHIVYNANYAENNGGQRRALGDLHEDTRQGREDAQLAAVRFSSRNGNEVRVGHLPEGASFLQPFEYGANSAYRLAFHGKNDGTHGSENEKPPQKQSTRFP